MSAPVILSIEAYDYFAAELASKLGCAVGEIERDTFPDGEHHLRVLSEVNDRDMVLVGGTVSDAATLELYDLANAVVENGAATLTLVVPWYGYATQDRASKRGEAVTSKNRAPIRSSTTVSKRPNSSSTEASSRTSGVMSTARRERYTTGSGTASNKPSGAHAKMASPCVDGRLAGVRRYCWTRSRSWLTSSWTSRSKPSRGRPCIAARTRFLSLIRYFPRLRSLGSSLM
jgi:hypothetical protein